MSQKLIRQKLVKFLDLIEPELIARLQKEFPSSSKRIAELKRYLNTLRKQLKKGHCFGLSVTHAAMDCIEKLDWWEETLVTLANWDESPEQLNQFIELSNSEESARWKNELARDDTNKRKIQTRILFERALNYIVSQHASMAYKFKTEKLEESTLLMPKDKFGNHHFELLDPQGNVQTIKKRKCVAGYFTKQQLAQLITEENFTGTIGIIHSDVHSIRIGYKNKNWILYDPEYDHRSLKTIHKTFTDKDKLIDELIDLMDNSLVIEIATTNPHQEISFPFFDSLQQPEKAKNLLRQFGLHMIAQYMPESLPQIVDLAAQSTNGCAVIAKKLAKQDGFKWSGLQIIAQYAPDSLHKILDHASLAQNGHTMIADALLAENESGVSGLDTLLQRSPKNFFSLIMRYAPELLLQALKLARRETDGKALIREALAEKNQNGIMLLHDIAMNQNTQPYLLMALELSTKRVKNPPVSFSESHILTHDQFMCAVKNYQLSKNKFTLFSSFKWKSSSENSFEAMLEMNSEKDDQKRYALAEEYIKHNPDKTFAQELNHILRMS